MQALYKYIFISISRNIFTLIQFYPVIYFFDLHQFYIKRHY